MKAKTIKASIRSKVNEWLASIEDEAVRDLLSKNVIVTGGCIVSMLLKEKVNDYDIYFRTHAAALAAANYYVPRFKDAARIKFTGGRDVQIYVNGEEGRVKVVVKSQGVASETGNDDYQYFEGQPDEVGQQFAESAMGNVEAADEVAVTTVQPDDKPAYRPTFLSANAITLSNGVQLVLRFIGEPDEIHKFYDFVHCTSYWNSWDGNLVLPAAALEAILTKELRYVGSLYPLCSIIRIRKFVARGWSINAGQILKMCMQLNDLDLKNIGVLDDQLTGVDAAYFNQVIARLKEKQDEDAKNGEAGKLIDTTYLATIIDRMF